jgi:peptidoglycan/LPS O-acetylase OafA/YrhL
LGGALFPAYYQMYARSHEIMHYLFTGLFLQSIWWLYANPGSNNPFWSLGYEFWYYVVFGILIFCQSREAKVALLFVVGLITGLKIWLLAPIWFFGVAVYVLSRKIYLSRPLAGAGLLLSVMAVAVSIYYLPYYPEPETTKAPLYCSGVFVRDCIIGLFLAAAIWFFEQAFSLCPINPWIEKPIRWIASHTFSLYLYHFPLLVFLTATGMFDPQNAGSVFLELILILGFILLLSAFTESKRHVWRQAFDHVWLKIEGSILNQFKA